MAANTCRVELVSSGIRELLHEVGEATCKQKADEVCRRCGTGYSTDTKRMGTRTIASVYTDDYEAILDNNEHNTLAKAVRG